MEPPAPPPEEPPVHQHPRWRSSWGDTLIGALALYAAGVFALELTHNIKLFPAVALIGSFMVPVTFVVFLYNHRHLSRLTLPVVAEAFFYGGILGVLAASIIEPVFVGPLRFGAAFRVGVVEEAVKLIGVLLVAWHHRHNSMLDGLILGGAAGMGFAALESMGYAFQAFLGSRGDLTLTVAVTLIRGILSPVGHGSWTAILAGVLFRQSQAGRFRVDGYVLGAYLLVVVLHGLWDGIPMLFAGRLVPLASIFLGQALVGALSIVILVGMWKEAVRLQFPPYLRRPEDLDSWE